MSKTAPAYITLYEKIRNDIMNGIYSDNNKLPGKRVIAKHYGLSISTVQHALELLEEEGYIDAKERSGFYISYQRGYQIHHEEPVSNTMDTLVTKHDDEAFPSNLIARSLRRIMTDYPDEILRKTEGKGLPSLRTVLSHYLAVERNLYVKPEQIIIGAGTEYMYSLITQLLGRDKIYGIEKPSYEKIARIYQANGIQIDYLKMGMHGILSGELERTNAKVLHITPYHSWPTGITADVMKRQEYVSWALARDAILVEDDYESEFTISSKPEDTLFALAPENVIYLNTFSRTISPGIRVSYMILAGRLLDIYNEKAEFYANTVPTIIQMLIADLIASGEFRRHINRVRRRRRREKAESDNQI